MTTDIGEIPLINMANVMLAVLKAAAERPVRQSDCIDRLTRHLRQVREDPELHRPELEAGVQRAVGELSAVGLIEKTPEGRFRLTPRGHTVLEQHPMGVDETVLAEFREFRDFVRRLSPSSQGSKGNSVEAPTLSSTRAYLDGYGTYAAGRPMTENPHPVDTAEHMAWDAGWFEALDEAVENGSAGSLGAGA